MGAALREIIQLRVWLLCAPREYAKRCRRYLGARAAGTKQTSVIREDRVRGCGAGLWAAPVELQATPQLTSCGY